MAYDWVRAVEPALFERSQLRATQFLPDFSWNGLGQGLAQLFELRGCQLQPAVPEWVKGKAVSSGFGTDPFCVEIGIGQLPGSAFWLMAESDLRQLMGLLLSGTPDSPSSIEPEWREAFGHFLVCAVCAKLQDVGWRNGLAPRLLRIGKQIDLTAAEALDIAVALPDWSFSGRLLLSDELLAGWRKYSLQNSLGSHLSEELAHRLSVMVHLEAGRVTLSQKSWGKLKCGDLLLLDSCTVVPGEERGRVLLTANQQPLFRGMLKDNRIKILEYPLYHEVETPMSQDDDDSPSEEEEIEEEELEDDEEEETEEEELEEAPEEEEGEEEESESEEAPAEAERSEKPAPVGLEQIPLTVVVEIGRFQMNLEKLRELQPGHLLELDVKPEEGVNLVINGRCVGRAELLRVGELMGVRILELG